MCVVYVCTTVCQSHSAVLHMYIAQDSLKVVVRPLNSCTVVDTVWKWSSSNMYVKNYKSTQVTVFWFCWCLCKVACVSYFCYVLFYLKLAAMMFGEITMWIEPTSPICLQVSCCMGVHGLSGRVCHICLCNLQTV